MRLLRFRVALLALAAGALSAGCWGDDVPSLDHVGALRGDGGEVTVLFGACPGETVERVELKLTDEDFEEVVRVLWAIAADGEGSDNAFIVGELPPGFREVTALDEPLKSSDSVQVVVTSSTRGTIPMSFAIDDLRDDEVLVRQDRYRSRAEFDDQIDEGCRR